MFRETVLTRGGVAITVMDSASQIEQTDRGRIIIAGSNGGQESGRVGLASGCALLILNDAGVGKDRAGIVGLDILETEGVPAATVGHTSAAISDGMDMWEHGVLSYVNGPARDVGLREGQAVAAAVLAFVESRANRPADTTEDVK
jgi:hypothetical protein